MYAQIHLELSICDQTTPTPLFSSLLVSPSLPVQWQLCCPQRDDWESVALPLQSYRSTAAGVSSSALPLCSLPHLFPLLLLDSLEKLAAATCWPLWEMLYLSAWFLTYYVEFNLSDISMYFPLLYAFVSDFLVSSSSYYYYYNMKLCQIYRNSHPHGSHYNPIMQQPALLAGHVTLPSNQTLNVGVAHVMRQPSTKKNKQHQMSARYYNTQVTLDCCK